LPIDIRLTAIPAPAGGPLAAHLAAVTGGADDEDIAVAVQGAETAGLDPYLGGPVADVLAACGALDSPVADLANVPHSSRPRAGSIEAALLLREFTGGRPWAHLDIAGAARFSDGDQGKGATGFGTRLLLRWLGGFSSA
jgi:leucyl aminopeptidase